MVKVKLKDWPCANLNLHLFNIKLFFPLRAEGSAGMLDYAQQVFDSWTYLRETLFYFILLHFLQDKPCVLTWMENKLVVSADSNPTFKTNSLTLSLFASWVSLCVWLAEGTAHRRREVLKILIGAMLVWLISNRKCTASPQALSSVSRGEECWVRFNYHSAFGKLGCCY